MERRIQKVSKREFSRCSSTSKRNGKSGSNETHPVEPSNSFSRKGCCSSILRGGFHARGTCELLLSLSLSSHTATVLCKFLQSDVSAKTAMEPRNPPLERDQIFPRISLPVSKYPSRSTSRDATRGSGFSREVRKIFRANIGFPRGGISPPVTGDRGSDRCGVAGVSATVYARDPGWARTSGEETVVWPRETSGTSTLTSAVLLRQGSCPRYVRRKRSKQL